MNLTVIMIGFDKKQKVVTQQRIVKQQMIVTQDRVLTQERERESVCVTKFHPPRPRGRVPSTELVSCLPIP